MVIDIASNSCTKYELYAYISTKYLNYEGMLKNFIFSPTQKKIQPLISIRKYIGAFINNIEKLMWNVLFSRRLIKTENLVTRGNSEI